MKTLLEKLALLQAESKTLIAKDDATAEEIKAKLDEIKTVNAKIEAQRVLDTIETKRIADEEIEIAKAAAAKLAVKDPLYAQPAGHEKIWKAGMGEYLQAVATASKPGGTFDNRLSLQNSASGSNENVGSEGGFLLDGDFVKELTDAMGTEVQVRNKIRMLPLTAANKLIIPGPDESSRARGSRWGGVQVYHAVEADTVTASKPKFREFELKLEKLMALCYATDEMLGDTSVLETVIRQAYADEMSFQLDDDLINGTGVGMALGILQSPALVTVPKVTDQATASVTAANINAMWVRLPIRSKKNAVWFINQEVDTALTEMAFGTGQMMHPLALEYLQKGTLKGAPVVPIEQASALGTKGDIILCDPTQYIGIDKNTPSADMSIHVRFLYDESLFRFIYRFNGAPYRNKTITPYKGNFTLSPFVTLASR